MEEKGERKEDGEIKKREGDDMGYTCTRRGYKLQGDQTNVADMTIVYMAPNI